MVVAYIGINVGVLAVAQALGASPVSAGLGLGLFGVLSIIRLRSTEMEQDEVAYYFCALALGLLGGFPLSPVWLSLVLMASVIGAVAVADHARLLGGYRRQLMVLDRAFSTEREAILYAAALLEAKILNLRIDKVDLVQDTTLVEVRYRLVANAGGLHDDLIPDRSRTSELPSTTVGSGRA
jgi:hypothetical protein